MIIFLEKIILGISCELSVEQKKKKKRVFQCCLLFVCVEVLRPSQPNGVMSSAVSLPTTGLLGRLSPLSG